MSQALIWRERFSRLSHINTPTVFHTHTHTHTHTRTQWHWHTQSDTDTHIPGYHMTKFDSQVCLCLFAWFCKILHGCIFKSHLITTSFLFIFLFLLISYIKKTISHTISVNLCCTDKHLTLFQNSQHRSCYSRIRLSWTCWVITFFFELSVIWLIH